MSDLTLRDYQEQAIAAVLDAQARGRNRGLISLPPGSGKTIIFASLIHRLGGRALVLCHRDELIGQAVEKLNMVAPELRVGVVQAERNEIDAPVIVASVPTLAQPRRRAQLPDDFTLVVADECHHGAAPSWRAVLEHVNAGDAHGPFLLGVTASPDRADGIGLDWLYGDILYELSLLDLIDQHYLSPLIARRVLYQADYRQLEVRHGDVTAGSAERAFLAGGGPAAVVKAVQREAISRRHILVFTAGILSADVTAAALTDAGISAAAVNGEMSLDARRATLARFRRGEVRVLTNCQLLSEGADFPMIDCVVLARPTKSRALFLQMAGRGFRRHPAKHDCLLLDLTATSSRLQLVTPASLVGLDAGEVRDGESLSAAAARKRAILDPALQTVEVVDFSSRPIDILRQRRYAWVPAGENRYTLPLGDGQLILRPDREQPDRWSVIEVGRAHDTRVLRSGLTIDWAMSFGEGHATQHGAGALINPRAKWRGKPATENQLRYLRVLGVTPPAPQLSCGEASALIAAAKAARYA